MSTSLTTTAHAKLNLFLRLLGRRPDGYHEILTCFHEIDLHDELALHAGAPGIRLTLAETVERGLAVPPDATNLVVRAAELYAAETGVAPAWRFELRKRIPAGAGLGGGSSDAAAALRLLDAWHHERLGTDALTRLAAKLGADVPFFVRGGTQLGSGIGTELQPIADAPVWYFALLLPPYGTSTADVYKNAGAKLTMPSDAASIRAFKVLAHKGLVEPNDWSNELEPAACAVQPALATLITRVRKAGFAVRMSGSGSASFVPFAGQRARDEALAELHTLVPPEVRLLAVRTARPRAGPATRAGPGRGGP